LGVDTRDNDSNRYVLMCSKVGQSHNMGHATIMSIIFIEWDIIVIN
jgi:hypothetical protein